MDKTALLVLDVQVCHIEGLKSALDTTAYLSSLSQTIVAARAAGVPVIQVTVSFRDSYADASPRNISGARVRAADAYKESDPAVALHTAMSFVAETDIRVTKRRVSAFHGTDLEVVLKSLGVGKIVIAGVATSGAVLSTVRQAADMDYEIVVLEDLCADSKRDVHEVLVGQLFPKQGTVMSSQEWTAQIAMGGK
ncbi:Uu.00g046760.m01.CDS01 [Anthostomella pinea]|uniref:Uu.00g046760.m01.CDS01 n=1 Tax=Anthostomella pinea TaxID=933095 RepID=A0AAI8VBI2_9PEZI|nr:Uu.00g046760.m01.CDS01 [Anthostomella pinea]